MDIIEVKSLVFEYPKKRVLHDISFQIETGNITALVGPNGAGKTTLMRCLTGLENALSGTVIIDGIDVFDAPRKAHQQIGYLSDFFGLYDSLTVRQCLQYMAWCHKIDEQQIQSRIETVAAQVEISDYLDEKAGSLSRGYRQRLGVGLTLLHQPKLLLLDEPASGMDPEARMGLSKLMTGLKDQGMTIVVSSHILAELEDYCTDMLVIREGAIAEHVKLIDHETTEMRVLTIEIEGLNEKHIELVRAQKEVNDLSSEGEKLTCVFEGGEAEQHQLLKLLIENDVKVYGFRASKKSLQSAYMDLAHDYKEGGK